MARRIAVLVAVAVVELDDETVLPRLALIPGPRSTRPPIIVPAPSKAPDVEVIEARAAELVEQHERRELETVRPPKKARAA